MITLYLHDETYVALAADYRHKEQIKALADYPDVKWAKEERRWLMHVALLPKLYECMGDDVAPAGADFWCDCPLWEQGPTVRRRRSTQREIMADKAQAAQAAGVVGRAIVELMHREAGQHDGQQ